MSFSSSFLEDINFVRKTDTLRSVRVDDSGQVISASNTDINTSAEFLLLDDDEKITHGFVEYKNHGFQVNKHYLLGETDTSYVLETDNIIHQNLFYVVNEDILKIDVDVAYIQDMFEFGL